MKQWAIENPGYTLIGVIILIAAIVQIVEAVTR